MIRVALTLSLLAPSLSAQVVTEMTPERIREAIAVGTQKDFAPYMIGRSAMFSTPWSRVAMAASKAKKKYQTLKESDFTEKDLAPEMEIAVTAYATKGNNIVSPTAVVVRLPDGSIVQPLRSNKYEETFHNAMGGEWKGQAITAAFALSVISTQNEVRIVYDDGHEVKWKFKDKIK